MSLPSPTSPKPRKLARQRVNSLINDLYRSKGTSHWLPEDVFLRALEGYAEQSSNWPAVRDKAKEFQHYLVTNVSDCVAECTFRRPIGTKQDPAASISIYRLMAIPLRQSETLFGASRFIFTFWRAGLWFLSTSDPLFTTDHLHQRLVERAARRHESLVHAQYSLSIFWPILHHLLKLEQQRQGKSIKGNFISPMPDGLIFGEMTNLDMSPEVADAAAPEWITIQAGSLVALRRPLVDIHSNGNKRFSVLVRTFVDSEKLKAGQRRLKEDLDRYVRRHSAVLELLRRQWQLAYRDPFHGDVHCELFTRQRPTPKHLQNALAELDAITSSGDWLHEIERSIENRSRRHNRLT